MRTDLSPREKQVRAMLCRGLCNKEIANQLGLSVRSVESHRANIMQKTGCKNIVQLVRQFYGIVDEVAA